jgi:hypothetical protein
MDADRTGGVIVRRPERLNGMQTLSLKTFLVALCVSASTPALALECTVSSGPERVALLELYTSEGCSSCPPADKWVSELGSNKSLQGRVLPLAFHVDYWNQLGWTDPFSQPAFTARQRDHSRRRGATFVFTPQTLLNGEDYRRGNVFDDFSRRVRTINESAPAASITLRLSRNGAALTSAVEARTSGEGQQRRPRLFLALYENKLANVIKAGENKGLTLHHDFVVRKLIGPVWPDDAGKISTVQRIELDPRWKPQDVHVAAFVEQAQSGAILQAVAAHCD